jgi:hypothetical protein
MRRQIERLPQAMSHQEMYQREDFWCTFLT